MKSSGTMAGSDADLIEASLAASADVGDALQRVLFERFFAAFPDRSASFYNADVSSRRMTDETLQIMHGLASGEEWVWPLVAELVFTHRNYGPLPMEEYDVFIDIAVDVVGDAAGESWSADVDAAWRRQANALKAMIREAREQWTRVMPGSVSASSRV
jgi:hemoglobin-like flavoprotein